MSRSQRGSGGGDDDRPEEERSLRRLRAQRNLRREQKTLEEEQNADKEEHSKKTKQSEEKKMDAKTKQYIALFVMVLVAWFLFIKPVLVHKGWLPADNESSVAYDTGSARQVSGQLNIIGPTGRRGCLATHRPNEIYACPAGRCICKP